MVKVSICIPAYNQPEYLRRNLDSIREQSFQDYEVIITDDSADDSLRQLIDEYDFGGRLFYYHNVIPLGSPKNWNYGLSKARGTYIKPMHHDDWFSAPDSLSRLVELMELGDDQLVFSGCANVSPSGKLLFRHTITQAEARLVRQNPAFLYYNNRIGSPSVTLFRAGPLRFDERIRYLVDSEFYIRLLQGGASFSYTAAALINIGHHPDQVTRSVVEDRDCMFKEYFYTYSILPQGPDNTRWYFETFWRLVQSFDIRHPEEIKHLVSGNAIPRFLPALIRLNVLLHKTRTFRIGPLLKWALYLFFRRFDHR